MKTLIFHLFVLSVVHTGAVRASGQNYPPTTGLAEVKSLIDSAPREHPRLLASPEQLHGLRELTGNGSLKQLVAKHIIREADALLDARPVTRALQGRRLLGQSRRAVQRVLILSTAHHVTGKQSYVQRCEKEMLAAAAFSDWNPSHFLDVAEMTFALAIGYDWLFEALQPSSREQIRTAIVEKSLKLPFETRHSGWVRSRNNWGQVCHGGLTAGALAVLEDEPDLAARTVHNALKNVTLSMDAYAPKGSYPEGPSYWGYGTSYNVILIAALESVLGTDFGLSNAPGFNGTGQYLAMVTGPSGATFNYADGGSGRGPEPALFWFADRFSRTDWLRQEFELLRKNPSQGGRLLPLTLLWMDESKRPEKPKMPLHWNSGGSVPISIHRSSWNDKDALFVGLKGGSPSANHGQMDTGSFVLDADGVRWALDLGAEGYYGIESRGMNLWSRSQKSDRWTIFRQMNQGHNTLVIDDQLQTAAAFGKFEQFSDNPEFPHSIIDLTPVYSDQARSARRGMALLPSRRVLIQDELKGLRPGAKVRWGMITPADPGKTGTTKLRLALREAELMLTILSPSDAVWKTINTETPRNEWDSRNAGTTMVAFEATAPDDGSLTLQVLAQPGSARKTEAALLALRPLDQW